MQKPVGKVTNVHCQNRVLMGYFWIWSVFSLALWIMECCFQSWNDARTLKQDKNSAPNLGKKNPKQQETNWLRTNASCSVYRGKGYSQLDSSHLEKQVIVERKLNMTKSP